MKAMKSIWILHKSGIKKNLANKIWELKKETILYLKIMKFNQFLILRILKLNNLILQSS